MKASEADINMWCMVISKNGYLRSEVDEAVNQGVEPKDTQYDLAICDWIDQAVLNEMRERNVDIGFIVGLFTEWVECDCTELKYVPIAIRELVETRIRKHEQEGW